MGRSLKSAGASSRVSRIFTRTVSPTGTSSPKTLLSPEIYGLRFCYESKRQGRGGRWLPMRDEGWTLEMMEETSMYCPIQADRWPTGQVLLYLLNKFRKEEAVLRMTARKLATRNPERRPSMLQVAASPSDVANVAVERKASRSLQDTVELGGENAKPQGVKNQTFSARQDGVERSSSMTCGSRSMIVMVHITRSRIVITVGSLWPIVLVLETTDGVA